MVPSFPIMSEWIDRLVLRTADILASSLLPPLEGYLSRTMKTEGWDVNLGIMAAMGKEHRSLWK